MKRWHIKLALLGIFIFNLGFFQAMGRLALDDIRSGRSKLPTSEEQVRRWSEYKGLSEKILGEARAKAGRGEVYTPDDYFNHLLLLDQKRYELGEFAASLFFPESDLQEIMRDCFNRGYTQRDIDNAFMRWREITPRYYREAKEVTKKHAEVFGSIRSGGYSAWFWRQYLKNLGLAFVLFLIWSYEGRSIKAGFILPNPLYFLVALIFYPIVIAYVFWRWLQDTRLRWQAEAELRRTKEKIFASLSQEDLRRLRQFLGNRRRIAFWRQELSRLGLRPRHSLAAALLATVVLMIAGSVESRVRAKTMPPGAEVLMQVFSQHLPRMALNDAHIGVLDPDGGGLHSGHGCDYFIIPTRFGIWQSSSILPFDRVLKKATSVSLKIEHVPRSAVWL